MFRLNFRENLRRMREFHSTNNVFIDLTEGPVSDNQNIKKSSNKDYFNSNTKTKSNNFLALVSPNKTLTKKTNLLSNDTINKPVKNGLNIQIEENKLIKKITPMHLKLYESTQQTV